MQAIKVFIFLQVLFVSAAAIGQRSDSIVSISVISDKKVLNPMQRSGETASLAVKAVMADSRVTDVDPRTVVFTVSNKLASGSGPVLLLKGNNISPGEGGMGTVTAVMNHKGNTYTATTDIAVRPYYRDYHQTLVLKLFMGMEGKPVERLKNEPLFQKQHDVMCTFEKALDVIRNVDNITSGMPKIIYLVGWQKGGHDHQYPSWDIVNPRLKRPQDSTALQSLRWLIGEARKYHTTVSLHINMTDAYRHSPLWDEYVAKDVIAKDEQGRLLADNIAIEGDSMFTVSYTREWQEGLAQRRIDGLIEMIPELKEGRTIHIDVFVSRREHQPTLSPWHASKENGGIDIYKEAETQHKIFRYWRKKGFDVTGEGIFWAHPPGEGFYGLQPMSWWYPDDKDFQMRVPEYLSARGRTHRKGDGDFRFGSSMQGEEIFIEDIDGLPGFLQQFCRTTLPWQFLSRYDRLAFVNDTLFYSDGIKAYRSGSDQLITMGDFVLRRNDDLLVPVLWENKALIAYSETGYSARAWQLPADWNDVKLIDLYEVTMEGRKLKQRLRTDRGKVTLTVPAKKAFYLVPAAS